MSTGNYVIRANEDRRSDHERRKVCVEQPPEGPVFKKRAARDRRRGWEDREGWLRKSTWSSAPMPNRTQYIK